MSGDWGDWWLSSASLDMISITSGSIARKEAEGLDGA